MFRLIKVILSLLFILLHLNIFSQDVLDGVYKKQLIVNQIEIGEYYISGNISRIEKKNGGYYLFDRRLSAPEDFFVFPYAGQIKVLEIDSVKLSEFQKSKAISIDGCVFFNPSLLTVINNNENRINNKELGIQSIKYYIPKIKIQENSIMVNMHSNKYILFFIKNFTDFFEPFYIKKTEVSNAEYREFTNWVIDSIARRLLVEVDIPGYCFKIDQNKSYKNYNPDDVNTCYLNWDKPIEWNSDDEEYLDALKSLYLPFKERYYRHREFDANKFIYAFNNEPNVSKRVSVYPDTLVWMSDYTYSYNEPFAKNYFWHSDYSEYPVVGVSWEQSKAFCDWKTRQMQKEFDIKGLPYKVVVDLPTSYQREFALTDYTNYAPSESWYWDLNIDNNAGKLELGEGYLWTRNYSYGENSYFLTNPCDLEKISKTGYEKILQDIKKRNKGKENYMKENEMNMTQFDNLLSDLDKNRISGMRSNVSEWMNETYHDNWEYLYNQYRNLSDSIDPELDFELYIPEEIRLDSNEYHPNKTSLLMANNLKSKLQTYYKLKYPIKKAIEDKFIGHADSTYRLIKGSNWYDETFKRQTDLSMVKTFAGKNSAYATVGFRYIVKIYPKD